MWSSGSGAVTRKMGVFRVVVWWLECSIVTNGSINVWWLRITIFSKKLVVGLSGVNG